MTQKLHGLPTALSAGRADKLGRPAKTPGLGEVLFVRTNVALIEGLDRLVARERQAHPGRTVTRADVVRDILYQAINNNA